MFHDDSMRPPFLRMLATLVFLVALSGCFTMFNHPSVSPDDRISESGSVVEANECLSCHVDAHIFSRLHNPIEQRSKFGFYYDADRIFAHSKYYSSEYYSKWAHFTSVPWWYTYRPSPYRPVPGGSGTQPHILGVSERRTGWSGIDDYGTDISGGLIGPGISMPRSTERGQVATQPENKPASEPGRGPDRVRRRETGEEKEPQQESESAQKSESTKEAQNEESDDPNATGRNRGGPSQTRSRRN